LNPPYFVASELITEIELPQSGMLSRTLYDDGDVKLVLFGFAAGHELSAHSAPMPASLFFLKGEATVALGTDIQLVKAGAFVHMPPGLMHAVEARTPLVMLLIMMKGLKPAKLDQVK
jgi:quercetin dioxygenase-like cupin family protein